ncbi:MAG: hypothetical protein ACHQ9S_17595 [Candidatus Binatia bacterium]
MVLFCSDLEQVFEDLLKIRNESLRLRLGQELRIEFTADPLISWPDVRQAFLVTQISITRCRRLDLQPGVGNDAPLRELGRALEKG